jgi:hypothetical protein
MPLPTYYPNPGALIRSSRGITSVTNLAGDAAIPNSVYGVLSAYRAGSVRVGTDGNGTSDSLERNVISGNGSVGVYIYGEKTDNNVVAGNYIGVNAAGDARLANGNAGVRGQRPPEHAVGTDGLTTPQHQRTQRHRQRAAKGLLPRLHNQEQLATSTISGSMQPRRSRSATATTTSPSPGPITTALAPMPTALPTWRQARHRRSAGSHGS